jgi:hypothetical protein
LSIAAMTSPAAAETIVETSVETVEFSESGEDAQPPKSAYLGVYGPFHVVEPETAELRGVVDPSTPAQFRRMMADHPRLRTIRMIDCPGTEDDDANLQLARMVRRMGLATHVPAHGSVRSGGVELFLAGVKRTHEPGAEFGVHSWEDENGRDAFETPASDPVHARYVRFYVDMGFDPQTARAFYAFTNAAAPADGLHIMTPQEIAHFRFAN